MVFNFLLGTKYDLICFISDLFDYEILENDKINWNLEW